MRHAFLLLPSSFILFLSACAPAQSLAPLAAPSPTSFALYISDAQATLAAARGQATEAARAAVQATEIAAQKTAAWDEQQNAYAFSARQTQDAILVARQAVTSTALAQMSALQVQTAETRAQVPQLRSSLLTTPYTPNRPRPQRQS